MSASVLVTYASRYGSTQEVAGVVAATLREGGLGVDILPMKQVESLAGYQAVVIGAPLYIGQWEKPTHRFLATHREALAARAVAFFTLGPVEEDESKWTDVHAQLAAEMEKVQWLKPLTSELFGGKYDPLKLRFPDSLLAKMPVSPLRGLPAMDVRDWEGIREWAAALASKLNEATSGQSDVPEFVALGNSLI